jgi:hypothetical protein
VEELESQSLWWCVLLPSIIAWTEYVSRFFVCRGGGSSSHSAGTCRVGPEPKGSGCNKHPSASRGGAVLVRQRVVAAQK